MTNVTRWLNSWKLGTRKTTEAVRLNVLKHRANTLQVSGLTCIAAAGFVIAVPLGLFVGGLFLCLIGWAVDE